MRLFIALSFSIIVFIIILRSTFKKKLIGTEGEKRIAHLLRKLSKREYKSINNIMIKSGMKTCQIDHVVISKYGIFVIETKNYSGEIIGNEFDNEWTHISNLKTEKIYNPIRQNYGHIMTLKRELREYNVNFISIVVYTNKAKLKLNVQTPVIYESELIDEIKRYNNNTISYNDIKIIYDKIMSMNVDSFMNRRIHNKSIRNNLNSRENDICPLCGGKLVIKHGRYGKFLGCSNYPVCHFTNKI